MVAAAIRGTKKASTRKRTKRDPVEQAHFDGLEPPRHKDIDKLALAYKDSRDARQAALLEEVSLKSKLLAAMNEHQLEQYKVPGHAIQVVVEPGEAGIKVKKVSDEEVSVP